MKKISSMNKTEAGRYFEDYWFNRSMQDSFDFQAMFKRIVKWAKEQPK